MPMFDVGRDTESQKALKFLKSSVHDIFIFHHSCINVFLICHFLGFPLVCPIFDGEKSDGFTLRFFFRSNH